MADGRIGGVCGAIVSGASGASGASSVSGWGREDVEPGDARGREGAGAFEEDELAGNDGEEFPVGRAESGVSTTVCSVKMFYC